MTYRRYSTQPSSRQELYDRIRDSSKDEVILEEMIRLGFWPAAGTMPDDPADEIRRRGELEAELRALRTERSRLHNIEALKKEARKRRMAESRRKRQETKERRLQQRVERAAVWAERKKSELLYLGEEVSAGLGEAEPDAQRLARHGLPSFSDAAQLARAMGLSLGALRQMCFDRATSRTTNYIRFVIPKRTGGVREISAPRPRLKEAQRWVLDNILSKIALHDAAHGFRDKRSIVSNAHPHVQPAVLVNVDLKDFFPTVTYRRVKGMFRKLGYSESLSTVLGLLCSEPRATELSLDGVTYYVALQERALPQGAPTSPAVTNIICRGLDARLCAIASKLGFVYTRYADDLTFSSKDKTVNVGRLLRQLRKIVDDEGFVVHPDKTRVLRAGRRQEVTGIVVNHTPNVTRDVLRKFRATLYQIEKDGPQGKTWGHSDDVIAAVEGFANYVAMVNPDKGRPLVERARALVKKHGKKPTPPKKAKKPAASTAPPPQARSEAPAATAAQSEPPETDGDDGGGKKKKKKWWKIF
ncbi:MAG: RNA-directed DNA polymerase [Myxococcales bacterium]|nr:RNA-directed DNA polymerase [Myxococcales bacterium]